MPAYDVIRQGKVSSISYESGTIRVVYEDKNNAVTAELPFQSFEYDMPSVGDLIYVAHQSNGVEKGIVLGRYFNSKNTPNEFGAHIHRKEYGGDAFVKYDRITKTMTFNIEKIIITGDVLINGNAVIEGNLTVNKSLDVLKNVDIEKNLSVKGKSLISKDTEIKGNLEVKKNIHAVGYITADEQDIPDEPEDEDEDDGDDR